jgi:hypothetical protein
VNNHLEHFLKLSEEFFVRLREGGVTSIDEVSELSAALDSLKGIYQNQDSLPKELVGVMLDISTGLYSAADNYPEPLHSKLFHLFDALTDKMRDLCY